MKKYFKFIPVLVGISIFLWIKYHLPLTDKLPSNPWYSIIGYTFLWAAAFILVVILYKRYKKLTERLGRKLTNPPGVLRLMTVTTIVVVVGVLFFLTKGPFTDNSRMPVVVKNEKTSRHGKEKNSVQQVVTKGFTQASADTIGLLSNTQKATLQARADSFDQAVQDAARRLELLKKQKIEDSQFVCSINHQMSALRSRLDSINRQIALLATSPNNCNCSVSAPIKEAVTYTPSPRQARRKIKCVKFTPPDMATARAISKYNY